MIEFSLRSITLLACAMLAACNGAGVFFNDDDPRMDALESSLAQCTTAQAENQQQLLRHLQLQREQLERQEQKLDVMSEAMAMAMAVAQRESFDNAIAVDSVPVPVSCDAVEIAPSKLIIGRQEQVWLDDLQLALSARVDTGAETASLDARNIEMFERNSKRWVRFEILHPDTGETLQLERRLKRTVSIIQSNTSEPERRPVIKLGITIGHIKQNAEFTLSNRSHLDYQILVGRNILKDVMIVDVSKINIAPPALDDS